METLPRGMAILMIILTADENNFPGTGISLQGRIGIVQRPSRKTVYWKEVTKLRSIPSAFSIRNCCFPGRPNIPIVLLLRISIIKRKVNSVNPANWIKTGIEIKKYKPDILLFRFWLPFMGPCFGTIAQNCKIKQAYKNHMHF